MRKQILNIMGMIALFLAVALTSTFAQAQETVNTEETNMIEELDPQAANIEEILQEMDREYLRQTGKLPYLMPSFLEIECRRFDCPIYAEVRKSEQRLYLYQNGALKTSWLVSTGKAGKSETPLWEGHPNGRIYDAYTSAANPGGDYKGLGNMPYAVFLSGGYAVHGTPESNWKNLGKKASHGCVRSHPDNGKIFNRLVRQYGVAAVWVAVIN